MPWLTSSKSRRQLQKRALLSFMQSLPPTPDKAIFGEEGLGVLKELVELNGG